MVQRKKTCIDFYLIKVNSINNHKKCVGCHLFKDFRRTKSKIRKAHFFLIVVNNRVKMHKAAENDNIL
jgi:hypothetical protein